MQKIDIRGGIQVGGYHFAVRIDEETHNRLIGENLSGQCCHREQAILVDPDMTPERISEVALHEFVEAVNVHYCAGKLEHAQILQIAYGLHQIMEHLDARFAID